MFRYSLEYVKNLLSKYLSISISFACFCYFSFHLVHGDRGLFAYMKMQEKYAKLSLEYKSIAGENEKLDKKIGLIKNNIDLDLLEELAQKQLGIVKKGAIVILRK